MLRCIFEQSQKFTILAIFLSISDDFQVVHRNEGKYPSRGPGFHFFKVIRQRRPDLFGQTTGLLSEEGEDWQRIRSQVQQGWSLHTMFKKILKFELTCKGIR